MTLPSFRKHLLTEPGCRAGGWGALDEAAPQKPKAGPPAQQSRHLPHTSVTASARSGRFPRPSEPLDEALHTPKDSAQCCLIPVSF